MRPKFTPPRPRDELPTFKRKVSYHSDDFDSLAKVAFTLLLIASVLNLIVAVLTILK